MGQKVNPNGIRLYITTQPISNWFAANSRKFAENLEVDNKIRKFLMKQLTGAAVSKILIERLAGSFIITILSARPGVILGHKGGGVTELSKRVSQLVQMPVNIRVEEIRKPELDATLVAENIAQQLERRVMFRRAMKRAVQTTMRNGAQGIRINVAGRLGGAEIARTEWYREGRIPLHTFRAIIDYGTARAETTYGIIGVKVWIFKGEVFHHEKVEETDEAAQ